MSKQIKFKRFLVFSIFIAALISLSTFANKTDNSTPTVPDSVIMTIPVKDVKIAKVDTVAMKDSIKKDILNEVIAYMNSVTNRYHKTIPSYLVNRCLDSNFDICFALSQGQLETGFGTAGWGLPSQKHSIFGVRIVYQSYEKCIDGYISLVQNKYLGKYKTVHDLMNNYVTLGGAKYAGNPKYEIELRKQYNTIVRNTKIAKLQKQYAEL